MCREKICLLGVAQNKVIKINKVCKILKTSVHCQNVCLSYEARANKKTKQGW